jgi:hypothetical protein
MKVIFLDIDGVLVNLASFGLPESGSGSRSRAHPDCVTALNAITDATGAVIVVSSVWRIGGLARIKDILREWGVTGKVLSITPDLCHQKDSHLVVGGVCRGDEIQRWLDDYAESRGPVESFVILDDASDMRHLLPRLVQSRFETGLTPELARRAVELLGGVS